MLEEIEQYEKYLASFSVVTKPKMPQFDVCAYTDIEYVSLIKELLEDYNKIDDEYLIIAYLKGE